MLRGGALKGNPLLATPFTVATTFPVAAPAKAQKGKSSLMPSNVVAYQLMSDRHTQEGGGSCRSTAIRWSNLLFVGQTCYVRDLVSEKENGRTAF
jgi:hypothetical protein